MACPCASPGPFFGFLFLSVNTGLWYILWFKELLITWDTEQSQLDQPPKGELRWE